MKYYNPSFRQMVERIELLLLKYTTGETKTLKELVKLNSTSVMPERTMME